MLLIKTAWRDVDPAVCGKDLYSVLSPVVRLCQLFGIFPLTLKGPVGKRKYSSSYGAIIYSLIVLVLTITGLSIWTDNTNERIMKLSNHIIVLVTVNIELKLELCSMVVMVVAAIVTKDKFGNVIHTLSLEDVALRKLGTKIDYAADSKRKCIQLGIITLVIIMLMTFDFNAQSEFNLSYPLNWVAWMFPNIVRIVSACLFADIILILKQRFAALNKNLIKMIEESKDSSLETISTPHQIPERLRSIAKIHGVLCETALSINQIFGLNIIVGAAYALIILTTAMYYIYQNVKDLNRSYMKVAGSLNWGIMSSIHLIYIVTVCQLAQNEAGRTGKLIHKFQIREADTPLTTVVNKYLKSSDVIKTRWNSIKHLRNNFHEIWFGYRIQSFSLQLHHEKIEFSGGGLFPLNATLIQSIVGAVTTYLVIIIQFDTSATEANGSNEGNNSLA